MRSKRDDTCANPSELSSAADSMIKHTRYFTFSPITPDQRRQNGTKLLFRKLNLRVTGNVRHEGTKVSGAATSFLSKDTEVHRPLVPANHSSSSAMSARALWRRNQIRHTIDHAAYTH